MGTPPKQLGNINLMTPEQSSFLSQSLGGMGPSSRQALQGLLQPYSEDFFQKSVVDPTMKRYQEQILPAIGEGFGAQGASSSSALNQALAQSAQGLAGSLAGQRIGLQSSLANQNLGGLGALGSMLGQRQFQPLIEGSKQGILGSILSALGQLGGGYFGA